MKYEVEHEKGLIHLEKVMEVQITEGAYHFYNCNEVLMYSIPVSRVIQIRLIEG